MEEQIGGGKHNSHSYSLAPKLEKLPEQYMAISKPYPEYQLRSSNIIKSIQNYKFHKRNVQMGSNNQSQSKNSTNEVKLKHLNLAQSYNLDPYLTFYNKNEQAVKNHRNIITASNVSSVSQFPIIEVRSESRKELRMMKQTTKSGDRLHVLREQLSKPDIEEFKNTYLSSNVSSFKQAFKNFNKAQNTHLQSEWELTIIKNEAVDANNCKYMVGKSLDGRLSQWIVHNNQSATSVNVEKQNPIIKGANILGKYGNDSIQASIRKIESDVPKRQIIVTTDHLKRKERSQVKEYSDVTPNEAIKEKSRHVIKELISTKLRSPLEQKININFKNMKKIDHKLDNQTSTSANNITYSPKYASRNAPDASDKPISEYNRFIRNKNQKKVELVQKQSLEELLAKEQEDISSKFNQLMTFSLDSQINKLNYNLKKVTNKQKNILASVEGKKGATHQHVKGVRFNLDDDVINYEDAE